MSHKTFEEFLGESPMIIDNINVKYISRKLISPIQEGLYKRKFTKTTNKNIYEYTTPSKTVMVYSEKYPTHFSDIIGGALFEPYSKCGAEGLICSCSKKFSADYSNILLEIFKCISENELFIMTDEEHTHVSKYLWSKWISQGEAKDVHYFNKEDCSEINPDYVWGKMGMHKNRAIIAKF